MDLLGPAKRFIGKEKACQSVIGDLFRVKYCLPGRAKGFFSQKNPLATQKLRQRPGPFGIHYFTVPQKSSPGFGLPSQALEGGLLTGVGLSACFATSSHQQPQRQPTGYFLSSFSLVVRVMLASCLEPVFIIFVFLLGDCNRCWALAQSGLTRLAEAKRAARAFRRTIGMPKGLPLGATLGCRGGFLHENLPWPCAGGAKKALKVNWVNV